MTSELPNPDLRARIEALVRDALHRSVESIEPIASGLGSRRFFRVRLGAGEPSSVVARVDAPEDPALRPAGVPPEPPLEPIRALLERAGLPVFACHASAPGLMLLEDVGSLSLEAAAATLPAEEVHGLYTDACSLVPRLQRIRPAAGVAAFSRRLDDSLFAYKAEQVVEWVLPWGAARSSAAAAAEVVRDAFRWIAREAARAPQRLAHRDFKAANIHLRQRGGGGARLVLIDLQGAFLAPPEYDLVCLLRDSHVELDEAFVQAELARIRPELPDAPDPASFARRFALMTLSRNGKDLARYLYAARTRGDGRYLRLLPRAVATLQRAASEAAAWDPVLGRLADLLLSLEAPPSPPSQSAEPTCAR